MMRQDTTTLNSSPRGRGLFEITDDDAPSCTAPKMRIGLVTLFVRHTSASLVIQENADPAVHADLDRFFARLVPTAIRFSAIATRGPTTCRRTSARRSLPCSCRFRSSRDRLALGTWQGVYLWEHRTRPHRREVVLHDVGGARVAAASPKSEMPQAPRRRGT